jgi:hypothetical protein
MGVKEYGHANAQFLRAEEVEPSNVNTVGLLANNVLIDILLLYICSKAKLD